MISLWINIIIIIIIIIIITSLVSLLKLLNAILPPNSSRWLWFFFSWTICYTLGKRLLPIITIIATFIISNNFREKKNL